MARYNEILVGRYNRGLQKLLGMKGEVPSPQISGDVQADIILADCTDIENRTLFQVDSWALQMAVTAVAAQNDAFRVRNPVTSRVIAVIEKLLYFGSVAGDNPALYVSNFTTDLASINSPSAAQRDGRMVRTQSSLSLSHANNVTPSGTSIAQYTVQGANNCIWEVILVQNQELVLAPGFGLQLLSGAVNLNASLSVWWRERALEESEFA